METDDRFTPPEIREGVRSGIFASIQRDVELLGGRTARLLLAAGIAGVACALGGTLLVSIQLVSKQPPWHVAVCSALWTGLLVVSFAIAFLRIRTPALPLARATSVAILGLGLAGICSAACPDQHFLHWWSATDIGAPVARAGGLALSALCFGLVTTLCFGAAAAFLVAGDESQPRLTTLLPASALLMLLAPGVLLQSVGTSFGVLAGWLVGTAVGAYAGVASGAGARALLSGS